MQTSLSARVCNKETINELTFKKGFTVAKNIKGITIGDSIGR